MPGPEPSATLWSALCFFTRLPLCAHAAAPCQGVVRWLPVVGLLMGCLLTPLIWLAAVLLPSPLCGAAGCVLWVALTGGLHLDGLADSGDGLLVEAPPERRLEIMRDARVGTFGALALICTLLLKTAALCTLGAAVASGQCPPLRLLGACCLAATLGRCAVFLALRLPSARPGGLGTLASTGVAPRHAWAALGLALALCALNGLWGLYALATASLTAWLFLSMAQKRLGGVTGDIHGGLIELVETAVLACTATAFHI